MNKKSLQHPFTPTIVEILRTKFGGAAEEILRQSPLLEYLNIKTKSANAGSKSRGAFANHYALYVVVEDYVKKGYLPGGSRDGDYRTYEGARFSDLLRRQRELPFGRKLQNHALNARLNDEFKKYFYTLEVEPIVRDVERRRYWIQEDLLNVDVKNDSGDTATYNLAESVLEIIDAYVSAKTTAFDSFIEACSNLSLLNETDMDASLRFLESQLQPNVDARIFEIVTFSILKAYYAETAVFWGFDRRELKSEMLTLFKTGRTNANDGGIDFVMRPLGRFFQVTETIDVAKFLLDIEKVQRYPITFVIKSKSDPGVILDQIRQQALVRYGIEAIVTSFMAAIEGVINIPIILDRLSAICSNGRLDAVLREVITQSKLEFNHSADAELDETATEDEPDDSNMHG